MLQYIYCPAKIYFIHQQTHTNPKTNQNTVDREITVANGNITLTLFSLQFELSHRFSHQHYVELSRLRKASWFQKTLNVPTLHVHVVSFFSSRFEQDQHVFL